MKRGLTWREKLDSIAERIGEPDVFLASTENAESDTPYFDGQTIEDYLYRSHLSVLRKLTASEVQSIGFYGIGMLTALPGATLDLNALRILSGQIQVDPGGAFEPAELVDVAAYYQSLTLGANEAQIFTIVDGELTFKGASLSITYLIEPGLGNFQDDGAVLPPGYDEETIDATKTLLMTYDMMPMGRF